MVKSIITFDTILQGQLAANNTSYNIKIAAFKAMELRYLGVYVEIHVSLHDADAEKIPPIVMKPKEDTVPAVKGSLMDPLVFAQRFEKFKRSKEAYTKLLKHAFIEGRRIFATYNGKCKIAIVRKRVPVNE